MGTGSELGTAKHGMVFYGTSNDGTMYVFSKNGYEMKPAIIPINHESLKGYGTIRGAEILKGMGTLMSEWFWGIFGEEPSSNVGTGYYNPKQ